MRRPRFLAPRIIFALIIITLLSIMIDSILYWISRIVSQTASYDYLGLGLVLFVGITLMWIVYGSEGNQMKGQKRISDWFDSKLGGFGLETRYSYRLFLFRMGVILSLGASLYGVFATLGGGKQSLYVDIIFSGLLLAWFSPYLISDKDIALVLFRKFKSGDVKIVGDFRKALQCYNKSVGFRFSREKLSAIAQYVDLAYTLKLDVCKSGIDARLNEIIQSLENKQYGKIPDIFAQLSTDCDSFLKTYSSLGIRTKPSLWTRAKENLSSSALKTLPKLIWLLILIAAYLILRPFIQFQIPFP